MLLACVEACTKFTFSPLKWPRGNFNRIHYTYLYSKDISSSPPLFRQQQPFHARSMKLVLVYYEKVPLIHILHSIILLLKKIFSH